MTERRVAVPVLLLLALTCASIAFFVFYGPDFPPTMAVHFGAGVGGKANGFMDRVKFIVLGSFLSFMLPAFIAVVVGVLPRVVPWRTLNLPNKAYWAETPERREHALKSLLWFGLWLACLVQAFLIGINVSLMQANQVDPPALPMWGVVPLAVLFTVGTLGWAWGLIRAFTMPRVNLR
jgi:hypothetical protein